MTDQLAPTDVNTDLALGTLRDLLKVAGGLLAAHGLIGPNDTITPDNWQFIAGVIIGLAPLAWSWYTKIKAAKTAKDREAIAVQAGINLVSTGAALATDGARIASVGGSSPKPVTPDTAKVIIQNYGPTTDQLNEMSLKTAKGAN